MNVARREIDRGNFRKGRKGHTVQAIVIHIMQGTMNGTLAWFRNPKSTVSAHYGVSRKGEVVQYVLDEDTAQHAGLVKKPTAKLVNENLGINPNLWTIGIEHEGKADQEPTAAQMVASAELIVMLAARHKIPLDEDHIIPHRAIRSDKTCPGKIEVKELLALAKGPVRPTLERPRPGERRWSHFFGEHVILTRYVSDSEWYFLKESQFQRLGVPATTRWSEMPQQRPEPNT